MIKYKWINLLLIKHIRQKSERSGGFMLAGKRVIGVCITKIHERSRAETVQSLFKLACADNTKIMVFNSDVDFYKEETLKSGARSVYDLMNFDILDGIIVFAEHFFCKEIVDELINAAHEHNKPVVVVEREVDGCYSIMRDYTVAYKQVLNHIIRDHGVTDTVYIAGNKENDYQSSCRIQCYKEVLEENGIPFSWDNVDYGRFWNFPTYEALDRLLSKREKLPQAVLCANDSMAIAVCEYFKVKGYNVPDDVIVTGFDGMPDARYFNPKLTTCLEDTDQLVALCLELFNRHYSEKLAYGRFTEKYVPCISESCGCSPTGRFASEDAGYLFRMMNTSDSHERHMYTWINRMIDCSSFEQLTEHTHHCLLADSYLCLKSELFEIDDYAVNHKLRIDKDDKLTVVTSVNNRDDMEMYSTFSCSDMIPDLEQWADEDKIYIISSIYYGHESIGYYAVKSHELDVAANQINRTCKILDISFSSTLREIRQNAMRVSLENAALLNQYTKLPNLKGLTKWFEEFNANPENRKKFLTVSIYGLPNYRYIYEHHGIRDVEEALNEIATMLRMANPKNCKIAHISQDEFIVVNYYDDASIIGTTIQEATAVFFEQQSIYNSNNGKDYFVEVNCGCTVIDPHWTGSLETFIALASGEMYINRVKMGVIEVEKEKTALVENYEVYRTLIDKNLFNYHFQPIVEAATGEIYAYEALMRTDSRIGMNPFEVLEIASAYKRLYDIERATVFNVLERYSREMEAFGGRKVFINSIPGNSLNEADSAEIRERYSSIMGNIVFEITEQNSVSDDELKAIKSIGNPNGTNRIAIDDYGTGHSNIVNLLRYKPHIIKIDRFLISDVDKDVNKQMFVRSTIDFARLNGIKVLAEGVETSEELRTVIDFGVDYIQGYYTGRPAPDPISEIAPEIKKEFIR